MNRVLERILLLVFIVVLTRLMPVGKTIVPGGRFARANELFIHFLKNKSEWFHEK